MIIIDTCSTPGGIETGNTCHRSTESCTMGPCSTPGGIETGNTRWTSATFAEFGPGRWGAPRRNRSHVRGL
jgi:hypothetical protein